MIIIEPTKLSHSEAALDEYRHAEFVSILLLISSINRELELPALIVILPSTISDARDRIGARLADDKRFKSRDVQR